MKKIGASLILTVALTAAFAQTNPPAGRPLSLQDCFAAALKNNFDVRIERYEPQKSLLNLHAAYAGYDPTFTLAGTRSHNLNNASGGVFTNGIPVADSDSFGSSLGGSLPLGTIYSLNGNVADHYGTSPENSGGTVGVSVTQPLLNGFWMDSTRLTISAAEAEAKDFPENKLPEGGGLRLEWQDNGEGIALDNLPHVTEPFVTTRNIGVGLGLTIVKRIVERHGGRLIVDSTQGVSTKVTLVLPRKAQPQLEDHLVEESAPAVENFNVPNFTPPRPKAPTHVAS